MGDDGDYEYKGGIHQRYRHIWYRLVNGKIVDSDQFRHDLEERAISPEPRTCKTCKHYKARTTGAEDYTCMQCDETGDEWEPRSADAPHDTGKKAEDAQTVRAALDASRSYFVSMWGYNSDMAHKTRNAIAALDRIVGKEE